MNEGKKFYQMSMNERRNALCEEYGVSFETVKELSGDPGLLDDDANRMVENVIGRFSLPIGIAQNFIINGKKYAVPMVIEEPSVIAAASNGARLAKAGGGFYADADEPCMNGQLQVVGFADVYEMMTAKIRIEHKKQMLLELSAKSCPNLLGRGGGPRDLEVRIFPKTDIGPMLVIHLVMDVRDVMGANLIDTALEFIAPEVEKISGKPVRLRILSNLADKRLARARCQIPAEILGSNDFAGEEVISRIIDAYAFAAADPYRAVTHNKGIMNGIDAVVMATGNDWRAIEAGAHAWASVAGRINPLSSWFRDPVTGNLCGKIELPITVGILGGTTGAHPQAKAAIKLLGVKSARELAGVIASVGLAQNLAALKALSTEGIQHGHMRLHAKQIAIAAGAEGMLADQIAEKMIQENHISASYAAKLLNMEKGECHA